MCVELFNNLRLSLFKKHCSKFYFFFKTLVLTTLLSLSENSGDTSEFTSEIIYILEARVRDER